MNSQIPNSKTKAYYRENEIEIKTSKKMNIKECKDEKNIVSKVRLNRASIYLCFCCARRRRSRDNVLIDEGMELISRRLDIFNIFEKIYKAEQRNEPFL